MTAQAAHVPAPGALPQPGQFIHDAIAAHAEADPGRPAIVSAGTTLSYGQLMERAALLASRLRAAGVHREVPVASCLPRGVALAPAVLGIWQAGGGYVPVAPDGPAARRDYIIRDSCAPVAVVAAAGSGPVPGPVATVISVDGTGRVAGGDGAAAGSVAETTRPTDLAYVIYTSGTTGRPKGVLVEHGNLVAMARSHEVTLFSGRGNHVRRVALNNVTTADSFFSDFVHLAYGRTLYVVDSATRRDPERLARFITDYGIEMLDGTPTQIRSVLLAGRAEALASLTVLVVGGEPTRPDLWRQLRELPRVSPYNLYGPTECTVAVTAASLREHPEPVIGTPLPGCEVWVVDEALRPVPDGNTGELCVTGDQVARGYLNGEATATDRFVWLHLPGRSAPARGYRTGDRGYRNQDGQLVFIGRGDDQVSIGGFRVELGEVETHLRACTGVRDAAVAVREGESGITLMAWASLDPATSTEQVRSELSAVLPPHMIPVICPVAAIPMGPSGKADIAALTKLTSPGPVRPDRVASPGSAEGGDVVATIREIWRTLLSVPEIRVDEDFFALGGDSLKATRMVVAIREALVPEVPIRVIFEHPRFQDFCAAITQLVDR